jgi:LDH2 family malate/lactate/ureidoglycolate dehydrogenase
MVGLDGGRGVGQQCANRGVELAIERAGEYGLACVVGADAGHIGRPGHYTSRIARAGFASILSMNPVHGQDVAPYGGAEGRLSNNPISIGAPASGTAVVADMALTNAAFVKVLPALDREQSATPEGWLLDASGASTTDLRATEPGGTLVPLGGPVAAHKGCGLIVLFDILAGALSGGGVSSRCLGRLLQRVLPAGHRRGSSPTTR